jgi:hypothetical protein
MAEQKKGCAPTRVGIMLLANAVFFAGALPPMAAFADEPVRNGNIWNSTNHQPTPAEEHALAHSEGTHLNTPERQHERAEIYTLDKQLLGKQDNLPAKLNP